MIYKILGVVEMCGHETHERLYEARAHARSAQAHLTLTKLMDVRHERIGHTREKKLQASLQHVLGVNSGHLKRDASECSVLK